MKFKSYGRCVEYLFTLERAGIKYDLKNIKELSKLSGNSYKKLKAIHIAGTNGKGSTASIISSILTESKYKVGLYTSPHITDFRERIRINGRVISKDYVLEYTNRLYEDIERIKPSFFEVTTAMAFNYFGDNKVDFAIIECGLGGRLDSTNILKPMVSVITSVSIDHSEYLGNTIKSIALEKAGIVKKGIPCVAGSLPKSAKAVVINVCKERGSKYYDSTLIDLISTYVENGGYEIYFMGEEMELPLIGRYQVQNLKTAFAVLFYLIAEEKIDAGFPEIKEGLKNLEKNTGYSYRFMKVADNPQIILDVSHNAEGLSKLKETLKLLKYRKLIILFGMMSDKDMVQCINELEKLNGFVIFTKPDYKRAGEAEEFVKYVSKETKFTIRKNVKEAYDYAISISKNNDLLIVTGSFFMVSDFLKFYKEK